MSTTVHPESVNKNYLQQTEILAEELHRDILKFPHPPEYAESLKEFEDQKASIAQLMGAKNWQEATKKLENLKLTQLLRNTISEWIYFSLVYFQKTGKHLLPKMLLGL